MKPDNREGSMPLWIEVFLRIVGKPSDQVSIIDLCCGRMGNTRLLKFKESIHIDVTDYPERPRGSHFLLHDVLSLPSSFNGKYDVALCSDGIEHLSKEDGIKLISIMEKLSKTSIIFTPLGDYMVDPLAKSPENHRSGWLPNDFPSNWETQEFPNWHPTLGIGGLWAWRYKAF
jgi:hypothetical protein